jgi:hypothetical protein
MATANLNFETTAFQPPRWIMSCRKDLFWFIGSVFFGYAILTLYGAAHVPLAVIIPIWAILFDETHNFATISRTFFDKEELKERRRLLWGSVIFFIIAGFALILAGLGDWLEIVTAVWAYHHLVKQHYGFMVMYKKKNDDLLPFDNRLDRAFFYVALWYPFLTLPFYSAEVRGLVLSAFEIQSETNIPASMANNLQIFQTAFFWLTAAAFAIYAARQIYKIYARIPINLPKLILFAAVLPFHYLALRYAQAAAILNNFFDAANWDFRLEVAPLSVIGIVAALTIYHNVQYHGIVWFYNQNRYRGENAREKYGLSAIVNTRLQYYVAFALVYAFFLDIVPRFLLPFFMARQSPGWYNTTTSDQLLAYVFAFPGLLHYWLDSRIWRVRRDKNISQTLNLNAPKTETA